MAQDFNILATSNIIRNDVARHNTNYDTLRSNFSGSTFPSNPTTGQACWRTDRKKRYNFTGDTNDGENGWVNADDTSEYIPEIIAARGSKNTLDQRLDIALNEDGTLKDNVTGTFSQYQKSAGTTYTYLTATTFKTNGNTTDIYVDNRRLKVNLTSSFFYSSVVSSSYNGTFDETTVTIEHNTLDNTLIDVDFHIVTPFNVSDKSGLDFYSRDEVDTITTPNTNNRLSVVVTPPTDADYTLTANENQYGRIEVNTTNWTVARNIIMNNDEHTLLAVVSGGQNATFKTSAGTGILVSNGEAKELRNDTANVINYESSVDLTSRVPKTGVQDTEDWNGTPYVDPDAVGANPVAKIYPDGTVVGSTDNGEYIKFPNGELICFFADPTTYVTDLTSGQIKFKNGNAWTYPVASTTVPKVQVTATPNSGDIVWGSCQNAPTTTTVTPRMIGSLSTDDGKLQMLMKGTW